VRHAGFTVLISEELVSGPVHDSYLGILGLNFHSGGLLVFVADEYSPSGQMPSSSFSKS
jgi:hypothetical protein